MKSMKSSVRLLLSYSAMRILTARLSTSLVVSEVKDRIGFIRLNDPSRMNALTVEMGDEFLTAVDRMIRAAHNQDIRACIVTGAGILGLLFYIFYML